MWPPCHVIWWPWKQKVSQMTSIGSQNGTNLASKIVLKLILKQKCKTSRNIIIYYVLWRSAISKNTHFTTYGPLKLVLNNYQEWDPKKTHKDAVKCRRLRIMDLKGDPKCCTLSPRNASWGHPEQQFWSPVAIYGNLAPTAAKKPPKWAWKSPEYTPRVTNSSHLSKVNQSQRRPLIPANLTGSARNKSNHARKYAMKSCHSTGQAQCP